MFNSSSFLLKINSSKDKQLFIAFPSVVIYVQLLILFNLVNSALKVSFNLIAGVWRDKFIRSARASAEYQVSLKGSEPEVNTSVRNSNYTATWLSCHKQKMKM